MRDYSRRLDPSPDFVPRVARLLELHEGAIKPGHLHELRVRHDPWCRHWDGGSCDCDPECSLVEVGTPERN